MVTVAMKLKDAYSFGRKVMSNLVSILKSRDITLFTKVHLVKAMVFPVGRNNLGTNLLQNTYLYGKQ